MIPLSELLYARMEVAAAAGDAISSKAQAQRRPLTSMEVRQFRLMDIEQTQRRHDWADVLRSEGRRVDLWESRSRDPSPGITVSNIGPGRPTVWLYGDIGAEFGGITADDFRRALAEIPAAGEFDLHVHSDGGNFHEAVAMHAMIQARAGLVFGFVDGRAASAATLPLMACATISMSTGSWLMIHEANSSLRDAKADDFANAAALLYETNEQIAGFYLPRWKGTREQLLKALKVETWLSAENAVAFGLADSIIEKSAIAASVSRQHQFKNVPAPVRIAARAEDCPNLLRTQLYLHRICTVR
jgi:ATP-dependent protease ClpP protease subunit